MRYLVAAKRIKSIIQAVIQLSDTVTKYLRQSILKRIRFVLAIISDQGHMALQVLSSREAVHGNKEHAEMETTDLLMTKNQRQREEEIGASIFPLVAQSSNNARLLKASSLPSAAT